MSGVPDPADVGGDPPLADDLDTELDVDLDDADGDGVQPDPDDLAADDDQQPDPDPRPRQPSRRERQQGWRHRAVAAETRLQESDRRLAEIERRLANPQPQAPDPRAQQQLLEQTLDQIADQDPRTMVRSIYGLLSQQMQNTAQTVSLQAAERADIAHFETIKERYPAAKRLAPQIEQAVQNLRAQGIHNINRQIIFEREYGRMMLERAGQQGERQRRNGAARVAAATTRPASGRGDVARGGGGARGGDADRALLESTPIDAF